MKIPRTIVSCAGALLLIALWQYAGSAHLLGRTLPATSDVIAIYEKGYRVALLARSARATMSAVAQGLFVGALLGIAVAIVAHLFPALRTGLNRLAVLMNAIPVIALGPILILCAGRRTTPAYLAALPVFFLMYMAASTGLLHAPDARLGQYLRTLGATRMQRLLRLEIPSSFLNLVTGLKTSVGSAMIGAIVGEWFGAPRGLGVVVINAMQNFQVALMWAAVMVIAAISLVSFMLLGILERAIERRLR